MSGKADRPLMVMASLVGEALEHGLGCREANDAGSSTSKQGHEKIRSQVYLYLTHCHLFVIGALPLGIEPLPLNHSPLPLPL